MAEIPDRLCDDEFARMPAADSAKLYYTATHPTLFGMGVCNGEGADAHVRVYLLPPSELTWSPPAEPPPYTVIVKKQRIESDANEGNVWEMPSCVLRSGDRLVVQTDLGGVTFNGHGFRITVVEEAPP